MMKSFYYSFGLRKTKMIIISIKVIDVIFLPLFVLLSHDIFHIIMIF